MKNFKQLFASLLLTFVLLGLSHRAEAGVVQSPKHMFTSGYTTQISSVTPFTVYQSTIGFAQPGAIYEIILSTGVAGDYVVLFDTIPFNSSALTVTSGSNSSYQLGPKFFYGSTTANTVIRFDPPIIFYSGLMVSSSGSTESFGITYEEGRGISGQ